MQLEIRALTADDRAAWWRLWKGYLDFYETRLADEVVETTWQRLLDPSEPMFGLLARWDGQAIGLVHGIEHRSCWTVGNYLYLQDLYTDASARGRGVATALIEAVGVEARRRGCSRVHWLTHETNERAQALYERVAQRSGFIQYRQVL